jgi:AhpC/TSA family
MRTHRIVAASAAVLVAAAAWAFPPNPTRIAPPPGIEQSAIAVGAEAPDFSLPMATGGTFTLADARKDGPVVLVFYRGYW